MFLPLIFTITLLFEKSAYFAIYNKKKKLDIDNVKYFMEAQITMVLVQCTLASNHCSFRDYYIPYFYTLP